MTGGTFTGIFLVLVLIIGIGVYSGKKFKIPEIFLRAVEKPDHGSSAGPSWEVWSAVRQPSAPPS